MSEYVCHYLTDAVHSARAVYHTDELGTAMAMHNASKPEYAKSVIKWVGPTGITFLMHDSTLTLRSPEGERVTMSGYTNCACRDCFETIIPNNTARPELCDECNAAGCGDPAATTWPGCQRDDAYGEC